MAQKFEVEITDYLCENFWVKSNEKIMKITKTDIVVIKVKLSIVGCHWHHTCRTLNNESSKRSKA